MQSNQDSQNEFGSEYGGFWRLLNTQNSGEWNLGLVGEQRWPFVEVVVEIVTTLQRVGKYSPIETSRTSLMILAIFEGYSTPKIKANK